MARRVACAPGSHCDEPDAASHTGRGRCPRLMERKAGCSFSCTTTVDVQSHGGVSWHLSRRLGFKQTCWQAAGEGGRHVRRRVEGAAWPRGRGLRRASGLADVGGIRWSAERVTGSADHDRLVAPLAPVWRPAVITTRAPVGSPANSFAVTRADSTRSSTLRPRAWYADVRPTPESAGRRSPVREGAR